MELTWIWWMWLVLGLLLLVGEMLIPTDFFIFFFGVGAVFTATTTGLGLTPGFLSQSVVFGTVSIVALVTFRGHIRALMHRDMPSKRVDSLVGEIGTTVDEIPAYGMGKVVLRGSLWNARNANAVAIAKATRVRVEQVDGITLVVRELAPIDLVEDMI